MTDSIDIHGSVSGKFVNIGGSQIVNFGSGARTIERPDPRTDKIFLSYGRGDDDPDYHDAAKSFMRRLYTDLTASNYKLWWDREDMPSRALTFLQEIRDAITPCRLLILVVGEHALKSEYVKAEWEVALKRCIPVIPILRNGEYASIPPELGSYHAPDFRDDAQYPTALAELKRILGLPDAPLATLYGVPALPPSYIERDILADVQTAVLEDSHKPIVVTAKQQANVVYGMGGIGKTTLASAISRAFPDGVFWLDIGKTPDLLSRIGDIGAVFGDPRDQYPDLTRARQRLTELLSGRRALLIWDMAHRVNPTGKIVWGGVGFSRRRVLL